MKEKKLEIAQAFYAEMAKKNSEGLNKYLHPDVQFTAPLAKHQGKKAYLEAAKNFLTFIESLKVRATLSSDDQATVIYDVHFPQPIGKLPTAALLTFQDGLIAKVELFYDARGF